MADNFDKFRPDWTVGTLTLTGGSTAFTATDANLILAAIREGDAILTPSGFFLPIDTLAQDGLSGTLAAPAPASAGGTFQTRIRYQSDNSRFTGTLAALVARMSSGNLQSLAGLEGLQDLMPIFTGPGAMGLIGKDEVGIQDPNGTLAKFAELTLAARQIFQTDENGAMKALSLAANKLLNTDANGDILLSDITARARTLLAASTGAAMMTAMGGELFGTVNNGGVIWPNGEVEQWGVVTTLDSGGGAYITYPRAFGSISIFIPTLLTDWNSVNFTPTIYQSWDWGDDRRTGQAVWCRIVNGMGGSGPLTVGNIRWYARGKA